MPTKEHLKYLQAQSLERKVRITQTRIIEWYQHYNGMVYVSFSGGKDSTVLLDLARRIYPDIEAVFSDTGLEYPEIREFVSGIQNVTWVKPEIRFDDVIAKYGYPVIGKRQARYIRDLQKPIEKNAATQNLRLTGFNRKGEYCPTMKLAKKWVYLKDAPFKVSEECCEHMKKHPLKKYAEESGKYPITAVMATESNSREQGYLKSGCNSFDARDPISQPMGFWTEQDVLQFLDVTKTPYCKIYGDIVPKCELPGQIAMDNVPATLVTTGEQRTGCMFCMFGVHLEQEPNRFQRMKVTHPRKYDYCIREKNGLGCGKVLDYIGVNY